MAGCETRNISTISLTVRGRVATASMIFRRVGSAKAANAFTCSYITHWLSQMQDELGPPGPTPVGLGSANVSGRDLENSRMSTENSASGLQLRSFIKPEGVLELSLAT